jgi:hypothetical protein
MQDVTAGLRKSYIFFGKAPASGARQAAGVCQYLAEINAWPK